MIRRWGRAAALAALCLFLAQARAQIVDATPPTPAHALSCLQREADPPKYPARSRYDDSHGVMRVLIRFSKPDAEPKIEVLANTADETMQDEVYRYLAGYRLPCLTPADGEVSAVQEFSFSNTDMTPLPLPQDKGDLPPMCIVMPREAMESFVSVSREIEHVVLAMVFSGDGKQPPEIRVVYSSGDPSLERAAVNYARQYRMPCRTGAEAPRVAQQLFQFVPFGARHFELKRHAFGLGEFLRMTQGIREAEASFDFSTMGCPFKVDYVNYAPHLPNEVYTGGKSDPNRAVFLKWLSQRTVGFSSDVLANSLFGVTFQIEVPCGALELPPRAAAAASDAAG